MPMVVEYLSKVQGRVKEVRRQTTTNQYPLTMDALLTRPSSNLATRLSQAQTRSPHPPR